MSRSDRFYLEHIQDAIEKARSYVEGIDCSEFEQNSMIQDAVIRQLEVIGEATKKLSESLRNKATSIPWKAMAGTRDHLAHGYFSVDLMEVFTTVVRDLPALEPEVRSLLAMLESEDR